MNSVLHILQQHKISLFSKYPVKSMAVFGSYSRGDFDEKSDVDIMVELTYPDGIKFILLAQELELLLQKKVDLVSKKGIKPSYYCLMENDLQYV